MRQPAEVAADGIDPEHTVLLLTRLSKYSCGSMS
jgi:hypothetical protein